MRNESEFVESLSAYESPSGPGASRKRRFRSLLPITAPLALAICIYLIFALWLARTKAPWCDEGWFANPSYNLAFHGQMGSNVVEPSGFYLNAYLSGIHERTYYMVPNHLVSLAGWFRLVGFSLFAMRLYSILWGVVTMLALFYIVRRLFADPKVAQLAVLLLSFDFMFLWSAADGRMEAPANALALCALAAYLHFRADRFRTAVVVSQFLLAAAVFTHPNALLIGLTIPVLAWRDDRARIKPAHLLLAGAPYVLFAAPWALYILQNPADFVAQFLPNAAGGNSARWRVVVQPWLAVRGEIFRHVAFYSVETLWGAKMNPLMVFIPLLYMSSVIWLLRNKRRHEPGGRTFLVCAMTIVFGFTFLNGFKAGQYLNQIVPVYDTVLAAWLVALWKRRFEAITIAWASGCAFILIQASTSVMHIRADEYSQEYLPAIRDLEAKRAAGKTIIGTAALGFGLGFHGFVDDSRLGLYSHRKADVIVLDRSYRDFVLIAERREPQVFEHMVGVLTAGYRLSSRHGAFWILERAPAGAGILPPRIKVGRAGREKSGEMTRRLLAVISGEKTT